MATLDDEIKTDACPSPPRGETDFYLNSQRFNGNKEKEQLIEEDLGKTQIPHNIPTFPFDSKHRKFRKPSKTKCDKVIYINNSKDVHIGSSMTYTINVGPQVSQSPPQQNDPRGSPVFYHKTAKIQDCFECQDAINIDHMIFLSGNISASGWKFVARKLGFSDGRIEQFYADFHPNGLKEVIYQCLLEWTQTKPLDALISRITGILWSCDEREAVDLFSHYLYPDK